jgi:hypothetical protein
MFNPFAYYRKSQTIQYNWIRKHPFQYVALNGTLLAMLCGYMMYEDRKFHRDMKREFDKRIAQS